MSKFLQKSVIFLSIIIGLQILIAVIEVPIPLISSLNSLLKEKPQIVYLGDSVIQHVADYDKDQSSIAEILRRLEKTQSIGDGSSSAHHLGIYEAVISYIANFESKPEAVILPINLGSFSPQWDQRPEYQFEKEMFALTNHSRLITSFYRPLAIFRAINVNTIPDSEFYQTPVFYRDQMVGTVSDFENPQKFKKVTPENLRAKYIYNYMYQLDSGHRKLKSLEKILATAANSGIRLFVYITPIDYEGGTKYVGPDFNDQVGFNAKTACSIVAAEKLPCLNLAFALESEYFDHPEYPNEHLNERGRAVVAQKLYNFFLKK